MNTFATDLSYQIVNSSKFWEGAAHVWPVGIGKIITGLETNSDLSDKEFDEAIQKQTESAVILSKSQTENHQVLAQQILLYSSLASSRDEPKHIAIDTLTELGNHPGVNKLEETLNYTSLNFSSFWMKEVLRYYNTIKIDDNPVALTNFQYDLWSKFKNNKRIAISAPTSAGKSYLTIEYLCQEVIKNDNFYGLYIVPTRALLSEVSTKISNRLKNSSDIEVSTIPTLAQTDKTKHIYVLTQERLSVLLAIWNHTFDLVIVDEAQSIGDGSRGMILQSCLESNQIRNQTTQLILLTPSATGFGNFEEAIDILPLSLSETDLSPVVQNKFIVDISPTNEKLVDFSLLQQEKIIPLGRIVTNRGLANTKTRLAGIALEFGKNGPSLVYATGPADAEVTAAKIASDIEVNSTLNELSEFISKHIHKDYTLSSLVKKGVAFHYGNMPSILREAIEDAFKKGHLNYLVCTTTLFQGVNLPAKNIFIDSPTRGQKTNLDSAALWNFAGRAGRLGNDIVGNVFLINYKNWDVQPFNKKSNFFIKPSLKETINNNYAEIISQLNGLFENKSQPAIDVQSAAGLLFAKAANSSLSDYIERSLSKVLTREQCHELLKTSDEALNVLSLPKELISSNWTVDIYGQERLYRRIKDLIEKGKYTSCIPINPTENAYQCYVQIFSRINKYILGENHQKFTKKLTSMALSWMRGYPISRLINDEIKYKKSINKSSKINTTVRNVFDFVESELRFKYVQLGKTYIDILRYALNEYGLHEEAKAIYDFPLALELGVSSSAGHIFIELGLSRITAATLESLIPDSQPSKSKAKEWLQNIDVYNLKLSQIIIDELVRKELIIIST